MKITRELIEKYHLDRCSPQEKEAIERWLEHQALDDEPALPLTQDSKALEDSIWTSLSEEIYNKKEAAKRSYFPLSIAASIMGILTLGAAVWWHHHAQSAPLTLTNTENSTRNFAETNGLRIAMAPKSKASITTSALLKKGSIDFCGAISIETVRDVEFTLSSLCHSGLVQSEKMTFRKGETYIAFLYRFASADELLVVNSKDMDDLPPIVRKQFALLFKS